MTVGARRAQRLYSAVVDRRTALDRTSAIATVMLCCAVWVLRRPDQLLRPYVWAEEYLIVNRTVTEGFWTAAFSEYVGYFLVPTSMIIAGITAIGPRYLPELEYVAATAIFLGTILLLVVPMSRQPLRTRCLMALLLVLAPMRPEVFGVALYSFWWVALWPAITLMWERDNWLLRVPALVFGGLSGLAGSVLFVPFALASILRRRTSDYVSTAILAALFALQISTFATSERRASIPVEPLSIVRQFFRNFGLYAFGWVETATPGFIEFSGFVIASFLGAAVGRQVLRRAGQRDDLLLFGVAIGVLGLLSSVTAPLVTHHVLAGPRYYFYPFVLTAWYLLLVATSTDTGVVRRIAGGLLAMSVLTLAPAFSSGHIPRSWAEELARCAQSDAETFGIPVNLDGSEAVWPDAIELPTSLCREIAGPQD